MYLTGHAFLMRVMPAVACSAGCVGGSLSEPRATIRGAAVNHAARPRSANHAGLEGVVAGRTPLTRAMMRNLWIEMMSVLADALSDGEVQCSRALRACACCVRAACMLVCGHWSCTVLQWRLNEVLIGANASCVGGCFGGCLCGEHARCCTQLLGRRLLRCCWSGRPPGTSEE